jgi:hypothetical protein
VLSKFAADVRDGLIASFRPRARHFRSTPGSGQFLSRSARLKGANLGHRGCKPLKNRQAAN